jgi:cystathionine beta-lyase
MNYNFTQAPKRKETFSIKWSAMSMWSKYANDQTLPFWVADMDFDVAPEIIHAMKTEVDRLTFGYSAPNADYFERTQQWLERRFDWQVDTDNIRIAAGTLHGLATLINIASNPGDGIIIQSPVYHQFAELVKKHKRTLVDNPLVEDNGQYFVNFDQLETLASEPTTTMLLLCSPHNPVGRVWTADELSRISDICQRNDVVLVSDEIHADLTRVGIQHIPTAKAAVDSSHIVTLNGTGKTFNLAGMHISHTLFENDELKAQWDKVVRVTLPNPISMAAVQAAYTHCDHWVDELRQVIDDNLAFTKAYLEQHLPVVKMSIPQGTYFAWLDFRSLDLSDKKIDEIMIKEANILLEGGRAFGATGKGWQRLNLACPQSMLEEGLSRMCDAFSRYT